MPKIKSHACSHCNEKAEKYEMTGIKVLHQQELAYQLCSACCKKLRPLSPYNPADVKERRDFWEAVWGNLVVGLEKV